MLGFKYRIYPNKEQEEQLLKTCGCVRFVYNQLLDLNNQNYAQHGTFLFKHDLKVAIPNLKKQYPWLKDVDSVALQQAGDNLGQALTNFCKNRSHFGYPKFKKKKFNQGSFKCVATNNNVRIENDKGLKLPKVNSLIKIKFHRELPSKIKSVVISCEAGKWFASFTQKVDNAVPVQSIIDAVGIDLNSKDLVVSSDGEVYPNPKFLKKSKEKLAQLQRMLSRKKKGSSNWHKILKRIQRLHQKIKNQRSDNLHKISADLVKHNDLVVMEDLNVAAMSKFNGSMVGDAGFSELAYQIEYKCKLHGKHFHKVSRWFPSTKQCSCCGNVKKSIGLSERVYECEACGFTTDRDLNSAFNILNEGLDAFK